MKKPEEAMEILDAYDLTGSLRGAAALVGCDHKTVAHWVQVRERAGGELPGRAAGPALVMVEPFAGKVEELVDRSHAKVRADRVHEVCRRLLLFTHRECLARLCFRVNPLVSRSQKNWAGRSINRVIAFIID